MIGGYEDAHPRKKNEFSKKSDLGLNHSVQVRNELFYLLNISSENRGNLCETRRPIILLCITGLLLSQLVQERPEAARSAARPGTLGHGRQGWLCTPFARS